MKWPEPPTGETYIAFVDSPFIRRKWDVKKHEWVPHHDQFILNLMTNPTPTSVTKRYASNLLASGINSDFHIHSIERHPSMVKDFCVGHYYVVTVTSPTISQQGFAATPLEATVKALTQLGVTFR